MANPKRAVPVTVEEKKERNRRYQQTRREKTDNHYARAYRRASQRAVEWVQKYQEQLWRELLAEELNRENDKPYQPQSGHLCIHAHYRAAGVVYKCEDCGDFIGTEPLSDETVADAANALEQKV